MYKSNKIIGILCFVLALCCGVQAQSGMNWTSAPNLLTPRDSGGAVISTNGTITILGGTTTAPLSVDTLTVNAPAWTAAPPLAQARLAPGVVLSPFKSTANFRFRRQKQRQSFERNFYLRLDDGCYFQSGEYENAAL